MLTRDATRNVSLWSRGQHGFTIVELLIVIVVIAILASISIVSYNGVQGRASDTAVQSDLRNFANKVMEYQAINGSFPTGHTTNAPGVSGQYVNFSVTKGAYATDKHNFVYCTNATEDQFIITAKSKSSKKFGYSLAKGLYDYTQDWGGVVDVCNNEGYAAGKSYSYGYNFSSATWWDWTG